MGAEDKYCENCDRFLESESDYTVVRPGYYPNREILSSDISFKCNACGSSVKELSLEVMYNSRCFCGKLKTDKETWDKAKPNWRKRFVIGNEWSKEDGKVIINHDCFRLVKCTNRREGKVCGKEWKDDGSVNMGGHEWLWT